MQHKAQRPSIWLHFLLVPWFDSRQRWPRKKNTAAIEIRKDWFYFIRNKGSTFSFPFHSIQGLALSACGEVLRTRGRGSLTLCSTVSLLHMGPQICHDSGDHEETDTCSSAAPWGGREEFKQTVKTIFGPEEESEFMPEAWDFRTDSWGRESG